MLLSPAALSGTARGKAGTSGTAGTASKNAPPEQIEEKAVSVADPAPLGFCVVVTRNNTVYYKGPFPHTSFPKSVS